MIQTPRPWPGGHQPQVYEAEDYGFLAAVVDGPKPARRPAPEIRDSHFAAQDKRCRAGEQPEENQRPAHDLQRTRESAHRSEIVIDPSARKAPNLFGSVLEK